jgi:hypothetical protein
MELYFQFVIDVTDECDFEGEQYLRLLAKYKPKFEWDPNNHEHVFHYTEGAQHHVVYYPTLKVNSFKLSILNLSLSLSLSLSLTH